MPARPDQRRTKIVATVGPACRDVDTLTAMVEAGMDVARLNFSHGDHASHAETADMVRRAGERAGRPVAVLQDLPGPKLRLGEVAEPPALLVPGETVTFTAKDPTPGDARRLPVGWDRFAEAVGVGEHVHLTDGTVRTRVTAVRREAGEVDAEVELGGPVSTRQGINLPGPVDLLPAVTEEDFAHLAAGADIGVDLVAVSFVRRVSDVEEVRKRTRCPVIAKFEKPQAVEDMEAIVRAADCIMVARGDLGIEIPLARVPGVQRDLIEVAGRLARPAITATQMLDSMVRNGRPTRAEVTDVATAILDGSDAVMLSQETAVGEHPVAAVRTMHDIAVATEARAPYGAWNRTRVRRDSTDAAWAVARSAVQVAEELDVAAIVVPTLSGRSARLVSAHRPERPVFALSPGKETVARCALMWGVQAALQRRFEVTEDLIADTARRAVELGWVPSGKRIVVTAGLPSGRPGTTSLVQVQRT